MSDLGSLYPGDAYVDWTGLDGYNWGTNPASPRGWRTFDQLFRDTYDEIVEGIAPSKPMMLAEVGSSEYGGSKADWIRDALARVPTEYQQIRALLWFDKFDDNMDWPIETSRPRHRGVCGRASSSPSTSAPATAASPAARSHRRAEPAMPASRFPRLVALLLSAHPTRSAGARRSCAGARPRLLACAPARSAAPAAAARRSKAHEAEARLLGRLDRRPDHRRGRPLGHERGHLLRTDWSARRLR